MSVRLSIAVQHHPSRAHLLPPLLDRLGTFELVCDPEPDGDVRPLRTYKECLRRMPEWATHRLILQDDAWPCEDFVVLAEEAIAERPDDVICFYAPGSAGGRRPVLEAARAGERWARVRVGSWVPTVATSYPAALALDLLAHLERPRYARRRGDDGPVSEFCKTQRPYVQPWAIVPSLVQHADRVPSLYHGHGKAAGGRNPSRTAAIYAGDDDPRG